MIGRPGIWVWARFERVGPFELKIRCYEATEHGPVPPSLQVLGLALKALHIAMGGSPSHADDRVGAGGHSVIEVPGGRVQAISVWPSTEDQARADEVYQEVWKRILEDGKALVGALGRVEESTVDGVSGIELTYGPAVALEAALVQPVPTPKSTGRIVEMSAVVRPSGHLKVTG